jgi:hypothetical protein
MAYTKGSSSSEWFTPPNIIEKARRLMGGIDLDPTSCASANEIVQANEYYSPEKGQDGFTLPWGERVWCNPPYGKGHSLRAWIDKFVSEYSENRMTQGLIIIPAYTAQSATKMTQMKPLWDLGVLCFLYLRTPFVMPDGVIGEAPMNGHVIVWLPPDDLSLLESMKRMHAEFKDIGAVVARVGE